MAALFSLVTVSDGSDEVEFLASGIPRDRDDLEGYEAFEDFTASLEEESVLKVVAEAYLYGEGETVGASQDVLASIMEHIENDNSFLSDQCDSVEDVVFSIMWTPEDYYGIREVY